MPNPKTADFMLSVPVIYNVKQTPAMQTNKATERRSTCWKRGKNNISVKKGDEEKVTDQPGKYCSRSRSDCCLPILICPTQPFFPMPAHYRSNIL